MAQMIRALALAGALAGTVISAPAMAAPVAAPTIPSVFATSRFEPLAATAGYDCWGRCGWRDDRRWRRNRVDAGDVVLGAVLIGGIAALISSENRRQRERERDVVVVERDPYIRDRDYRDDRRAPPRSSGASGLDNAANMCVDRIERERRVETVDNVARNAAGWQVTGALAGGGSFDCRIGNDGQIEAVDYGAGAAASASDGQWSDDTYAAARTALGGTVRPDMAVQETTVRVAGGPAAPASRSVSDRMPAYPGGPIPGEEIPENAPDQ